MKDLLRYFTQKKVIQKIKENDMESVLNEKISTIMNTPVITVPPDTSVTQLAQILKEHNIGAAPVVEHDKLIGIVTERDILQAMAFPQA